LYTLLFSIAIANGETFAFLGSHKKAQLSWAFWIVVIYFIKASDLILANNASPSLDS